MDSIIYLKSYYVKHILHFYLYKALDTSLPASFVRLREKGVSYGYDQKTQGQVAGGGPS